MRRRRPEDELQQAVSTYLAAVLGTFWQKRAKVIWFHVPNQRSSAIQAKILSTMGVHAGVPDLVLVAAQSSDPPAAFIELKAPVGRLSPAQKAFQERCEKLRIPYSVCRSVADVQAALQEWRMIP